MIESKNFMSIDYFLFLGNYVIVSLYAILLNQNQYVDLLI